MLGGRLNSDRREIDGMAGAAWARRAESELLSNPQVRILRRTTVFGAYDGDLSGARTFGALERVADHLPLPPAYAAAPATLEDRCQACRARSRCDRATHRFWG